MAHSGAPLCVADKHARKENEEFLYEAFTKLVTYSSETGSNDKLLRRLSSTTIRARDEFDVLERYSDGGLIEGQCISVSGTLAKDFAGIVEPATDRQQVMCLRQMQSAPGACAPGDTFYN